MPLYVLVQRTSAAIQSHRLWQCGALAPFIPTNLTNAAAATEQNACICEEAHHNFREFPTSLCYQAGGFPTVASVEQQLGSRNPYQGAQAAASTKGLQICSWHALGKFVLRREARNSGWCSKDESNSSLGNLRVMLARTSEHSCSHSARACWIMCPLFK